MFTITVTKEMDFGDLYKNSWGQAVRVLDEIEEHDLGDEFMQYLNEMYCYDTPTETELNDFISYDWESIYAAIGLDTDEEEEDED